MQPYPSLFMALRRVLLSCAFSVMVASGGACTRASLPGARSPRAQVTTPHMGDARDTRKVPGPATGAVRQAVAPSGRTSPPVADLYGNRAVDFRAGSRDISYTARLAQLVQSTSFTPRGSGVQIPQRALRSSCPALPTINALAWYIRNLRGSQHRRSMIGVHQAAPPRRCTRRLPGS